MHIQICTLIMLSLIVTIILMFIILIRGQDVVVCLVVLKEGETSKHRRDAKLVRLRRFPVFRYRDLGRQISRVPAAGSE